jgi:hypothetical protein
MLWRWTSSGLYSSSSAYAAFFHNQTVLAGAKEVWRIKAPHEHKFFLWLAIQDRCSASEHRRRHGLANSDDCALCGQLIETMNHLLVGCVFSREFWYRFLHRFDWQALTPPQ